MLLKLKWSTGDYFYFSYYSFHDLLILITDLMIIVFVVNSSFVYQLIFVLLKLSYCKENLGINILYSSILSWQ